MTGIFLSAPRVLPNLYPLEGELHDNIADEHTVGRLLDLGVIVPRLTQLYRSGDELPEITGLIRDAHAGICVETSLSPRSNRS
jgi:hypothetical protein